MRRRCVRDYERLPCWSPPPPSRNDAGRDLLEQLRAEHHRIALVWADGGYTGWLVAFAHAVLALALTIVKRSDDATGFVSWPLPW